MFTVKEAAAEARISVAGLYKCWKNGNGPVRTRVGGKVLIQPADLKAWLDQNRETYIAV